MKTNAQVISFDGQNKVQTSLAKPSTYSQLERIAKMETTIPRGKGLSYTLASAGSSTVSVDMTAFSRILEFSPENEWVRVETGISIGKVLEFLIPQGYWLAVSPGYPSITIGGCIGSNIHGKSHGKVGTFRSQVLEFNLLQNGEKLFCSSNSNSDLFKYTIGGLGLTGIITDVKLRIHPLRGKSFLKRRLKLPNLEDAPDIMLQYTEDHDFVYSWHDVNPKGKNFGAGVLYLEKFYPEGKLDPRFSKGVLDYSRVAPFPLPRVPTLLLNAIPLIFSTMEAFRSSSEVVDLFTGTFPILGKESYFYLFGRRGFQESQVIIPFRSWKNFAFDLKKILADFPLPVTLCSLKIAKGDRMALDFNGDGVSIALDSVAGKETCLLFEKIDSLVIKYEGVANIVKDSRLPRQVVAASFHDLDKVVRLFQDISSVKGKSAVSARLALDGDFT